MANPLRGEVGFKLDGEDRVYALDINRLCELEDMFPGKTAVELLEDMQAGRVKTARAVWWAGLQDYKLDLATAGVWLQKFTIKKAVPLMLICAAKAFPRAEPEAEGGGEGGADPR